MKQTLTTLAKACGLALALAAPALAVCPEDSVQVGKWCVDAYEASVWQTTHASTINKIQQGKINDAAQLAGKATQRGVNSNNYGAGCPDTGNGCTDFYAVSIPGVTPSSYLTWFQAAAACRNAGKELPPNHIWQAAALGTPDGAPCVVSAGAPGVTGTAGCESDVGAFDLVGNVMEWVAEWMPAVAYCSAALFVGTGDLNCMAIDPTAGFIASGPTAPLRGGGFGNGANAGVFSVYGFYQPSDSNSDVGFRCAR